MVWYLLKELQTNSIKKLTILEKRNHIGGNCYSEKDKKTNVELHKYGTHIFHTSNERVCKYLSNFCD